MLFIRIMLMFILRENIHFVWFGNKINIAPTKFINIFQKISFERLKYSFDMGNK